jgi:predicted small integral membrane protein
MDTSNTVQWFLLVHAAGLALWSSLAVLNNIHDFRGTVAAVGRTLSMALLDEAPQVPTPLCRRAIRSPSLHRLALLLLRASALNDFLVV